MIIRLLARLDQDNDADSSQYKFVQVDTVRIQLHLKYQKSDSYVTAEIAWKIRGGSRGGVAAPKSLPHPPRLL